MIAGVRQWFAKLFTRSKAEPVQLPTDWEGAGCIFTNGQHVLGGYQPHKSPPSISGIGGGREGMDRSVFHTAMRETLEELLNLKGVCVPLLDSLYRAFPPVKFTVTDVPGWGAYVAIVYTLDDLERLLRMRLPRSDLYERAPRTLQDLLLKRAVRADVELSHLCLMPVVDHNTGASFVSEELMKDINTLCGKN